MKADHTPESHPLAGQRMTGAEMVIQALADEGCDTVFGYSGGAILPTYDAIFRYNDIRPAEEQIRLIVPANEQGAGFMAAGYARSTGDVGVFLVTSGPGATNCVTPIRDCMADSVPVVLICGQVPRAAIGTDAFQEAPIYNIMGACAKHTFLVSNPDELEATVRTAFDIARSGRPGPVVIDLPKDVQNWEGEFTGGGLLKFHGYRQRMAKLTASHVNDKKAEAFFKMLGRAERPLLYVGGGVINSNAAEELQKFMDRFGIPAVTTLMGIGAVSREHDLSLHMLGMHGAAYANYAVEDCDFLIAVGSRFDDRVAGKVKEFAPGCRHIAHIDIDASEIGKVKAVDWCHVGNAANALSDLVDFGEKFDKTFEPWHDHIRALRDNHAFAYKTEGDLIQPQRVVEVLSEVTDGEAIVSTGVGQHQMWAAQYYGFKHPRRWLTSGSMGTMGFGLPAAIGAQIANPDAIVVNIDGDGSIRMNLGELETATTYNAPVKTLLLNNLGDGMVRQWQTTYFDENYSGTDKSLHKKDFIKAAEADGYTFAKRVTKREELRGAMEEFVAHKEAAFLEVMIDPFACVFPMVGPGMGYKQMDTGPYINGRDAGEDTADEPEVATPDLF